MQQCRCGKPVFGVIRLEVETNAYNASQFREITEYVIHQVCEYHFLKAKKLGVEVEQLYN